MYFIFSSVGSFTFSQVTFKDSLILFHRLSKPLESVLGRQQT